jgi:hypothetical protein
VADWITHPGVPGYEISRSSVRVTPEGKRHGCPEPALGRNVAGELAYWVRPMGSVFSVVLRIEGLKGFFA